MLLFVIITNKKLKHKKIAQKPIFIEKKPTFAARFKKHRNFLL
jgi:hypothetical protein